MLWSDLWLSDRLVDDQWPPACITDCEVLEVLTEKGKTHFSILSPQRNTPLMSFSGNPGETRG